MQFNSFILLFLPIMLITYFAGNKIDEILGKLVLIVGSIVFYAYLDWTTLIVLGISLIINYGCSLLIKRRLKWKKIYLAVPIIVNVSLLLYFKYTNFLISNYNNWFGKDVPFLQLALPIGNSFFTFQQIAYIVAIY